MEEVEVLSVQKIVRTTSAETVYVVVLAFESPIIRKVEKEEIQTAQVKIDIPGVPEKAPSIPMENKAILFLNQNEWKKCKKKLNVGDRVSLKIEKNGAIKIA